MKHVVHFTISGSLIFDPASREYAREEAEQLELHELIPHSNGIEIGTIERLFNGTCEEYLNPNEVFVHDCIGDMKEESHYVKCGCGTSSRFDFDKEEDVELDEKGNIIGIHLFCPVCNNGELFETVPSQFTVLGKY